MQMSVFHCTTTSIQYYTVGDRLNVSKRSFTYLAAELHCAVWGRRSLTLGSSAYQSLSKRRSWKLAFSSELTFVSLAHCARRGERSGKLVVVVVAAVLDGHLFAEDFSPRGGGQGELVLHHSSKWRAAGRIANQLRARGRTDLERGQRVAWGDGVQAAILTNCGFLGKRGIVVVEESIPNY